MVIYSWWVRNVRNAIQRSDSSKMRKVTNDDRREDVSRRPTDDPPFESARTKVSGKAYLKKEEKLPDVQHIKCALSLRYTRLY